MKTEDDMRAMAAGYRAMYLDAVTALLYIRDECDTKDEMSASAGEALEALGMGHEDA